MPAPPALPFLRACVLESVRLWPTTPMVLRQSTAPTPWNGDVLPAGAGVLIYVPFFHRDAERLPFADRFAPEVWIGQTEAAVAERWPLVPFSDGPAIRPGRQLVLLLSTAMLRALLERAVRLVRLVSSLRLDAGGTLPGTLNAYGLRFVLE